MDYYNTTPSYSSHRRSSCNGHQNEAEKDQDTAMMDVREQVTTRPSASASTKRTSDRAGRGMSSVSRATPSNYHISNYRISKKPPAATTKDQLSHARLAAMEALKKVREDKKKIEKEETETNKDEEKGKNESSRKELFHGRHDMPPPSATFSRRPSNPKVSSRRSSSSTVAPSRRPSSTVPHSPSTPALSGAAWAAERARTFKQANFDHMVRCGRSLVSRRPSDSSHDRDDLRLGVLFSAAHHTPCNDFERNGSNGEIDCADSYRTSTAFGVVYSKYRKFVAVRAVEYGIICLPIYTHQGTGCERRRNHHEYMAVRDSRDVGRCAEDGDRPFVIFHMNRQPNMPFLSLKSAILLTSPVFFGYSTSLTLEGRLLTEDIDRLQDAFRQAI